MFINKKLKKVFLLEIILLILLIIISYMFSVKSHQNYKNQIIKNNSYVISNIVKDYPDFEENVIKSIITNKGNYEEGFEILKKYGLTDELFNQFGDGKNVNNSYFNIYIFFSTTIFILGGVIYILFIKNEYNKLNLISSYMNCILNDDYSLDIREYEEGVISTLKSDIYKLTMKLKNMSEISMKDKEYLEGVLEDISHQIKTPLTSMNVINDLLLSEEIDPVLKKDFLNKNKNQIERIQWLVTSLLKISRLDSGSVVLKNDNVKVIDLLNKSLEPLLIPIELKNIKVIVKANKDIYFKGDMNWSSEAIINIIKNAYEHIQKDGIIELSASENPLYTEIKITDNGCGINKKDINHIFERFYKGSLKNDSIGIGLNMSKKIINLQNGIIEVNSKENEGTTFIIKFYKTKI